MFQSNRPWGSVADNWSMLWCLCSDGPLACVQIHQYSSSVVPPKTLRPHTQWPLHYNNLSSKQRWLFSMSWQHRNNEPEEFQRTDMRWDWLMVDSVLSWTALSPVMFLFFHCGPNATTTNGQWLNVPNGPSLFQLTVKVTTSPQELVLGTWTVEHGRPHISLSLSGVGGFLSPSTQLRPAFLQLWTFFSGVCASLSSNLAWTNRRTARLTLKLEQWAGRSTDGSSVRVFSGLWPRFRP